jgi:hypothetical protein
MLPSMKSALVVEQPASLLLWQPGRVVLRLVEEQEKGVEGLEWEWW